MKFVKMMPVEFDAVMLDAHMHVRYHEDAYLNGEEDPNGLMPLMQGDDWHLQIDLETGQIWNWPKGNTAKTHYKVCDAGWYRLYDAEGKLIAEKEDYVPRMLGPNGYGDYVILEIDEEGFIKDWNPDLDYFKDED